MSLPVIWSSCFLPGMFSSVHSFGFGQLYSTGPIIPPFHGAQ